MSSFPAGWSEFGAALAVFFATHILPTRPPIRTRLRQNLGPSVYLALYSALSLLVLGWLIVAAGRAPYVELWPFQPWQLWVPNIAMPLSCFLIAFGVAAPNPFSIEGRKVAQAGANATGIAAITRHPLLWAITLWAIAHMPPNGNLAHIMLFGLFTAFGLIGMVAIDKRRQREWGYACWRERATNTSFVPFAALLAGRAQILPTLMNGPRWLAAVTLYAALILLHPALIGVSPLPPV